MKLIMIQNEPIILDFLSRKVKKQFPYFEIVSFSDLSEAYHFLQGQNSLPEIAIIYLEPNQDNKIKQYQTIREWANQKKRFMYTILVTSKRNVKIEAEDFILTPFDLDVLLSRLHVAARIQRMLKDKSNLSEKNQKIINEMNLKNHTFEKNLNKYQQILDQGKYLHEMISQNYSTNTKEKQKKKLN